MTDALRPLPSMLCPSCLEEKGPTKTCKLCGFDESVGPEPMCLPFRHALQGGRYIVGTILGSPGGFGVAYKARARDSLVVIKEFQGTQSEHVSRPTGKGTIHVDDDYETTYQRALSHFKREAQFLEEIAHPNIVRVLEVFEENNTSYYVMPFVEGSDLAHHIKRHGVLPPVLALSVARDLLSALAKLHARGTSMLHCDIKPSNVLLTHKKKKAILIDFGAARRKPPRDATQPVLYSPLYAPPELVGHHVEALGEWSDLYMLCATLYECLTGNRPPRIDRNGTRTAPLVPIHKAVPGIDPLLASLIDRGLSLSPEQRPQSAQHELEALPPVPAPPPPAPPSVKIAAKWKWLGVAEAAMLAYVWLYPASWPALLVPMLAAAGGTLALPALQSRLRRVKGVELALIGTDEQRVVVKQLRPTEAATLGRSKDADVSIGNKRLSSLHACVVMNADGSFTLKDLLSLNHVYYRQEPETPPQQWQRIASVTLTKGGRFMLGHPADGGVLLEVTLTELQA